MKRPLPVPVQGTSLTDKDGKPTSHNYRWIESVGSALTNTQDTLEAFQTSTTTSINTLNTQVANLTTTVTALTGLTRGTAQLGTIIDTPNYTFTGIPSWVRRVSVVFDAVQIRGSSDYIWLQLGSGSIQNTGYFSRASYVEGGGTSFSNTSALVITNTILQVTPIYGSVTLTNITGNTWVSTGMFAEINSNRMHSHSGRVALSGTLDRVNLTTPGSGTSSSNTNIIGGTMNIFYE